MVELIAIRKFPAPMIASRRGQHFQTTSGVTCSLDGVIRHHHNFFAAQDDEHIITVRSPLFGGVTKIGLNRRPNGLSIGLGTIWHLNEHTTFGVGHAHTWNTNGLKNAVAANIVVMW